MCFKNSDILSLMNIQRLLKTKSTKQQIQPEELQGIKTITLLKRKIKIYKLVSKRFPMYKLFLKIQKKKQNNL